MRDELKRTLIEAADEFNEGSFDPETIIPNLLLKGIITPNERDLVKHECTRPARLVKLFLEILPSKDDSAFDVFVKILDKHQIHSDVLQLPIYPTDPSPIVVRSTSHPCNSVIEMSTVTRSNSDELTSTHSQPLLTENSEQSATFLARAAAFRENRRHKTNPTAVLEIEHKEMEVLDASAGQLTHCYLNHGLYQKISLPHDHYLYQEIDSLVHKNLKYTLTRIEEEGGWHLFAEDGEMKMYRKHAEGGIGVDPMKAIHTVKGVTAFEFCHYFFDPNYRTNWDTTVEKVLATERISEDTVICHQLHMNVTGLGFFGLTPREALFWSHIRRDDFHKDANAEDLYIVCNNDMQRDDFPVQHGYVRVGRVSIAMMCQTFINADAKSKAASERNRDDFTCKVVYVAQIHPGGCIPDYIANAVFTSEFPKFLKQFTRYVQYKSSGCTKDFQATKNYAKKGSWNCNVL